MSESLFTLFTQTCLISGRATALVLARGHDITTKEQVSSPGFDYDYGLIRQLQLSTTY